MSAFFQHPVMRRARILFRWCRIFMWLVVLLLLSSLAYLHLIGLPGFLKRPLLRRLLAQDVAAEFTSLQLGWKHGPSVIIENASFSRNGQPLSPSLSASRAELALDWDALRRGKIQARSLQVANAEWRFPVSETNGDALVLNNLALEMRFDSNDVVRMEYCQGNFRGIQLDLIGRVNHISDLSHWVFPGAGKGANLALQANLREVSHVIHQIHFTGVPVLQIEAGADGRDMNSFHAEFNFGAEAADTPWAAGKHISIKAACARLMNPGKQPFWLASLTASNLNTPWARGRDVSFSSSFSRAANSNLDADIRFAAVRFSAPLKSGGTNRFDAARVSWNGSVTFGSSNLVPLQVSGTLFAEKPQTPWGSARETRLDCRLTRAVNAPAPDATWGPWANFAAWTLDWQAKVRELESPRLRFAQLAVSGRWNAPQFTLDHLRGELYGGTVEAEAILDIATRELRAGGKTDFDPLAIAPLLGRSARDWMRQLAWNAPPAVKAAVRVVLPPWTNRPPNWASEVDSSLQLAGDFSAGPSSFGKVPMLSAAGHASYTNRTWHISNLHAVRPDGEVNLDYITSEQGFHYLIDGHMDPKAALPLIAPQRPHLLDEFEFHQPPAIQAEIWGSWREADRLGVTGTVRASNFTAHGESVVFLSAAVVYTNLQLDVREFQVSNAQCQAQAPRLQADFKTALITVTNATGVIDPALLKHLLRPHLPDWLREIRFDSPPSAAASGSFSLTNADAVDLHFLVNGAGVHYTNLYADRVTANVDWTGPTVAVTNIAASLDNKGSLLGWIIFPGAPERGPDFRADFTVRNIDLAALVTQLAGKTNHVEGRLDGDVSMSGPNSLNRFDWQGRGHVHVHDALLWDFKIFGLLSPVLNLISPGWGHSRAREATADFVIANSMISSTNVDVRCQGFRLKMHGSVDRTRHINARLEAVLSRETPVFGSFLSVAFTPLSKLFEYQLSGPINNPALEPVYVPKFIMYLLHPFQSLKSLSTPEPTPAPANPK